MNGDVAVSGRQPFEQLPPRRQRDRLFFALGAMADWLSADRTPGGLADPYSAANACARGHHDVAEVQPRHITWVAGERLEPGDRYCRRCHEILRPETAADQPR